MTGRETVPGARGSSSWYPDALSFVRHRCREARDSVHETGQMTVFLSTRTPFSTQDPIAILPRRADTAPSMAITRIAELDRDIIWGMLVTAE